MHCGPPVEPLLSTPSLHDSTHRPAPLHASNCWTSCGSVASQSGFGIASQAEERTRAFISTLQATPGRVPRPRRLPDLTSGPATCALPSSPAKTAASQKWTVDVSPSTPAPPAYHLGYLSVFPILNCKPSKHQTAASRQFHPPPQTAPSTSLPYHCDGLRPRLSLPADPPAFTVVLSCAAASHPLCFRPSLPLWDPRPSVSNTHRRSAHSPVLFQRRDNRDCFLPDPAIEHRTVFASRHRRQPKTVCLSPSLGPSTTLPRPFRCGCTTRSSLSWADQFYSAPIIKFALRRRRFCQPLSLSTASLS